MSRLLNALSIETYFSGNILDREDNLRLDQAVWEKWLAAEDSVFCLLGKEGFALTDSYDLRWFKAPEIADFTLIDTILLGRDKDGKAYFACSLKGEGPETMKFCDWRKVAYHAGSASPDLALIAQAKSMLDWHRTHPHCSRCGAVTQMARMGYERKCPSCEASHFPRTDPVVIMVGLHKESDSILLGRPNYLHTEVFTALAGFMEPGESIEEATARELFEEAGVTATKVHYIASQPWPNPSNIMIGCIAEIQNKELTVDYNEIEEARWFTRAEATDMLAETHAEGLVLPPALAIARQLVDHWVNGFSAA